MFSVADEFDFWGWLVLSFVLYLGDQSDLLAQKLTVCIPALLLGVVGLWRAANGFGFIIPEDQGNMICPSTSLAKEA